MLRAIVNQIVQPEVSAKKLRPRLIRGPNRSLMAVLNDTAADQTEEIALPAGYRRATDIHSDRDLALQDQAVRITVPYEDVVVLLLE